MSIQDLMNLMGMGQYAQTLRASTQNNALPHNAQNASGNALQNQSLHSLAQQSLNQTQYAYGAQQQVYANAQDHLKNNIEDYAPEDRRALMLKLLDCDDDELMRLKLFLGGEE